MITTDDARAKICIKAHTTQIIYLLLWKTLALKYNNRLVGWEINIPFLHKNRLYQGQGLGWRFSSTRLRMATDAVTSLPFCSVMTQNGKG